MLGFLDTGGTDEGQAIYRRTNNTDFTRGRIWAFGGGCMPQAARSLPLGYNCAEQSFYRWKKKFGGMEVSEAKRLRELERENGELKKIVAEQTLDIRMLKDVNSKKW